MAPSPVIPLHEPDIFELDRNVQFAIGSYDEVGSYSLARFPHRHVFYELCHVADGGGTHVIDFQAYPVRPNTLYLISPGQVHFWETDKPVRGRLLLFSEEFLLAGANQTSVLRELAHFQALSARPELRLPPGDAEAVNELLDQLDREYHNREHGYDSVLVAYLHVLLVRCQRLRGVPASTEATDRAHALVREFNRLVAEHATSEQSVRAYADRLGVSAGHLADVVKQVTGTTPGELVRGALLLEAKRLLAQTELTVAQIAHAVGMRDPSYFGRFFRQRAHTSPGEFRRRVREQHHVLRA